MSMETTSWGLEPLLSVTELAGYLGMPVTTVYDWRSNGTGPVGHRFGKHVKFAVCDVRAWAEAQRDRPANLIPSRKGGAQMPSMARGGHHLLRHGLTK